MNKRIVLAGLVAVGLSPAAVAQPSRGDYGLYERFLSSDAPTRRAILDDASMRPALAVFGTPPPAIVSAVPRWYEITANMRDLGGAAAKDGRRIRYGRLIRSAYFGKGGPHAGHDKRRLGIRTDLDLREPGGAMMGKDVDYVNLSAPAYESAIRKGGPWFRQVFDVLKDESRYPIAFHCHKGADRTGTLAALVELLLGVDIADVRKNWELTAFYNPNPKFKSDRFDRFEAALAELPGATPNEKAESFARQAGVTEDELATFRARMLEAPRFTFGLVSDTHITGPVSQARGKGRSNDGCAQAFEWFSRTGVDAVVNVGDVTEGGNLEEVRLYRQIFETAFPGGCCKADGRKVEHLSVWGNHDALDASYMKQLDLSAERPQSIPAHADEVSQMLDGCRYGGRVFTRAIRGVWFVGVEWRKEGSDPERVNEVAAATGTNGVYFVVQHNPGVPKLWSDNLKAHPNCIFLTGHSHIPLNAPYAVGGKDGWASYAAGSTSVLEAKDGFGRSADGRGGRHASIVRVWSDRVTIERRDVRTDQPIGGELEFRLENGGVTHPVLPREF